MLKAYNQKIIETPTYTEIWEYEKPIVYKVDENKNEEFQELLNPISFIKNKDEINFLKNNENLSSLLKYVYEVEERNLSVTEIVEAHKKGLFQEVFGVGTKWKIWPTNKKKDNKNKQ